MTRTVRSPRTRLPRAAASAAALALVLVASACSDDGATSPSTTAPATPTTVPAETAPTTAPAGATSADTAAPTTAPGAGSDTTAGAAAGSDVTLTLLAYDSFTPSEGIFDEFTAETGIEVEIAQGGDAGTLVSKAVLTAGNPEGDVLWGVDNTLLSRAVEGGVFTPYESPALADVPADLAGLAPEHEVTPVDYGDVCVNYDVAALTDAGIAPPTTLDELIDPAYADLLVVENPVTSSPGLAFLLATIAAKGDGWQDYWAALRDNGVRVVDDWDTAYYAEFTRAGGDRPLVVSYASSPPAEVLYADPALPEGAPAPTGVATGTCFRQVEFAGVLRGTDHEAEARLLVDYLAGPTFQADLPLSLFVYPANDTVALPDVFAEYTAPVAAPLTIAPDEIAANRESWIDDWTTTVVR